LDVYYIKSSNSEVVLCCMKGFDTLGAGGVQICHPAPSPDGAVPFVVQDSREVK
jgi:hypothetical protein